MHDIPCLAAAVPLGEGNCHSHVWLAGTEGSASRTGIKMQSFLPHQPAVVHTVLARSWKLPVPPWRDPWIHPPNLAGSLLSARSPQGMAGAALMGDTQTCMVTAVGWCWTAALGNWDMPCRLAQPLALPFTCTPDSCVINLLYYLVAVFHISGYHNTASPLDGCSHTQRTLPAFYESRFTGEKKQGSSSAFPQPLEQMGRGTDSSRWVTSPPKSKGGVGRPWHGWTNKGFTCQPLSWWAKKFLVEAARDLQCTSTKVFEVWKCVFILVWKKNQTLQTLPQTVFCCCHCCHWNIWFQTEKIGALTYIILCL